MFQPTVSPDACPALVLNADFRPLSYYPLSVWCWQDTIKAVFLDRVNIVSHYDRRVRSPGFEMRLPSVVSLKTYIQPSRNPAFTRFNVFLRDRFTCQYCGAREDLTFDHVIPRSKGGQTTWENVVTACAPCNLRKADRLPPTGRHAAPAGRLCPEYSPAPPERAAFPAQLPARELARLSLLGYRAGALIAGRSAGENRLDAGGDRQQPPVLAVARRRTASRQAAPGPASASRSRSDRTDCPMWCCAA